MAPTRAAAMTPCVEVLVDEPCADRLGHRGAGERANEVEHGGHAMACPGIERPRRDGRGDRVGRVVETVDVVEDDRQGDHRYQHQGDAVHASSTVAAGESRTGRGRPERSSGYPSRMRLSNLFFTTLRDDPADAEMASHRLLVRAGPRPPARIGDLLAPAAGFPGQQAGRAGRPRRDEPDRQPGDGDAGRPPGRRVARERPL